MLLVDSNVLIDVLEDDSEWAAWSLAQLRAQSQIHVLAINSIIYAEISCAFARIEELERVVAQLQLQVLDLPRPALFLAATNALRVTREEIFGPCASVIRVEDFDEALALANDSEYGLSAGICTGSLKHASAFQRGVRAGMVMVNLPTAGVDFHVPFGGTKGSSLGSREQGHHAVEFFTTVKTTYSFGG